MPRNAKILIRSGTAAPSAGDFEVAEPAWDKTAGKLYIKNAAGSMVEIGAGGGGTVGPISETLRTINQDVTLATGYNGVSVGPVEVAATYAVTVPANATWLVLS